MIVVATESHRDDLLLRLHAHGLDMAAAIEQRRYIALDASETASAVMVNDLPDPDRLFKVTSDLITEIAKAANVKPACIATCGDVAPLLLQQGKAQAAIQLERLWYAIAKSYGLNVLCAYPLVSFQGGVGSHIFEKMCSEHSAFCSR